MGLTKYRRVTTAIVSQETKQEKRVPKYLWKIGKEYYRKLQPVPWTYISPDYKKFIVNATV